MTKKLDFPKLLERVLKFISIRPRSRQEILNYLERRNWKLEIGNWKFRENQSKIKDKMIEEVIKALETQKLIDDEAFAAWWVEQRMTFRPKGKRALFFELKQKGLEKNLIEEILSEKIDELALAKPLAEKKWLSLKRLPPMVGQQKLVGFLSRRGFSWEVIKKVLDEILKKK